MSSLPQKRFYVYTLTDPQNHIFYVGKGTGDRIHQHETEARSVCACHKCCKIRKIWRAGEQIRKYYVFETDDEREAYQEEERLIQEIGMRNLCNKTVGGIGTRSRTNEEMEALQVAVEAYDRQRRIERGHDPDLIAWEREVEDVRKELQQRAREQQHQRNQELRERERQKERKRILEARRIQENAADRQRRKELNQRWDEERHQRWLERRNRNEK